MLQIHQYLYRKRIICSGKGKIENEYVACCFYILYRCFVYLISHSLPVIHILILQEYSDLFLALLSFGTQEIYRRHKYSTEVI